MTAPADGAPPSRAARVLAWLERVAASRGAAPATFGYALLQSTVLPGPSDTMFLPLAIANPRRALPLALVLLAGATIGTSLAWGVGAGAFAMIPIGDDPVVSTDVGLTLAEDVAARARESMRDKGWIFIALSPLTPISTKLLAYGAGALGMSWPAFMLPLTLGRLVRYAVLVPLIRAGYGDRLLAALGVVRAPTAPVSDARSPG